MHFIIACLLIVGPTSPQAETIELETRGLLSAKTRMLIPTHFEQTSEEMLQAKYPSKSRPTTVLMDERGTVNVSLSHPTYATSTKELKEAHRALERMFCSQDPSVIWYRSELSSINDQECFILELLTPASDTGVYNILVVTSLENRILIISVNPIKELIERWLSTGRRMVESITVNLGGGTASSSPLPTVARVSSGLTGQPASLGNLHQNDRREIGLGTIRKEEQNGRPPILSET